MISIGKDYRVGSTRAAELAEIGRADNLQELGSQSFLNRRNCGQ